MFAWFVAQRLFLNSEDSKLVSRPAIRIATLGITVGVMIMLISISVVLGFQSEVRNKVCGFGSHIQIVNYESIGLDQYKPIVVDDSLRSILSQIPYINHVQSFCLKPGMLKTAQAFKGVVFKGVDEQFDNTFLASHLIDGEVPNFSDSISSSHLLISQKLANQLNLEVGNSVYAYFFENILKVRKFIVSGIFCTNLSDFDKSLVYSDNATIRSLLGWDRYQYSGVELKIDDLAHLEESMSFVVERVNRAQDSYGSYYTSLTIKDMYPQIFSWLELLDLDVWVILILMTCVAGFTMISGLLIIILERTNFIGIMKALGTSNSTMRSLFLYFASFIIFRGILYGNIIALILLAVQNYTGCIHLNPDVYYVESVPVMFNWTYFLLIDIATLLVSMLALIIPSYLVSNIHPASSIRFE